MAVKCDAARMCGPSVKKVEIKFAVNPFFGQANPRTMCIHGCDNDVLMALGIDINSVRKPPDANRRPDRNDNANVNDRNGRDDDDDDDDGDGNNSDHGRGGNSIATSTSSRNLVSTASRTNPTIPNQSNHRLSINFNRNDSSDNFSAFGESRDNSNLNNQRTNTLLQTSLSRTRASQSNSVASSSTSVSHSRPSTSKAPSSSASKENRPSILPSTQGLHIGHALKMKPSEMKFDRHGNRMEFLPALPECQTTETAALSFRHNDEEIVLRARTEYDDEIVCDCNENANKLSVRKDGENQGRQFYKCGRGQCDFFLWDTGSIDDVENSVMVIPTQQSTEPVCNCPQQAVLRTVSKTGPNHGRKFYSCPKPMDQSCKFFQWEEEAAAGAPVNRSQRGIGGRERGRGRGGAKKTNGWKKVKDRVAGDSSGVASTSRNTTGAGRKCSNCKRSGHTKKTCPSLK